MWFNICWYILIKSADYDECFSKFKCVKILILIEIDILTFKKDFLKSIIYLIYPIDISKNGHNFYPKINGNILSN